jgi:hypothetical protein
MNWPTSKDPRDHISLVAVPTMAALIVIGIFLVVAYLWSAPS